MNVPRECFVLETGSGQCVLHVDYAAVARGEEAKAGDEASAPTGSGSGVDFTALTGLVSVSLGLSDYLKRRVGRSKRSDTGVDGAVGAGRGDAAQVGSKERSGDHKWRCQTVCVDGEVFAFTRLGAEHVLVMCASCAAVRATSTSADAYSAADAAATTTALREHVTAAASMIEFLYGPALETWQILRFAAQAGPGGGNPLQLERVADVIAAASGVQGPQTRPGFRFAPSASAAAQSTPTWLLLPPLARAQAEQALGDLMALPRVNAVVLLSGASIIAARAHADDALLAQQYLLARPLAPGVTVRTTPVYAQDHWQQMLTWRTLKRGTLVVFTQVDTNFKALAGDLAKADAALQGHVSAFVVDEVSQSGVVHMAHVASSDMLAVEVCHAETGLSITPVPRPSPRWAQTPVEDAFRLLRARCDTLLGAAPRSTAPDGAAGAISASAGTESCCVTAAGYRLVAHRRGSVQVCALFGDSVLADAAAAQTWACAERVLKMCGVSLPDSEGAAVAPKP